MRRSPAWPRLRGVLALLDRPKQPATVVARPLRIAMVAPPYFEIPPSGYGGVETVVADLVDALVGRGHHVTLIGGVRHATKAQRFFSTFEEAPASRLGEAEPEVVHAARVAQILDSLDVDVVHDHTLAGPLLARGRRVPTIVTVHGPLAGGPSDYYRALSRTVGLVAISDAQRASAPDLAWVATVHNAIPVERFPFRSAKEPFTLFLGRFHPDKAPHLAIMASRAAGLPVRLAGKCSEPIERAYFHAEVEPRLGPDTTVLGVADAEAKRDLLSRATCLVFPIRWEEPFGLVMIEAMACGTPVVALRRGAVPEVVSPGHTGVVVDEPDQLPDAILASRFLSSSACRSHVQRRFGTAAMAAGYEAAYRRVLAPRSAVVAPPSNGQARTAPGGPSALPARSVEASAEASVQAAVADDGADDALRSAR